MPALPRDSVELHGSRGVCAFAARPCGGRRWACGRRRRQHCGLLRTATAAPRGGRLLGGRSVGRARPGLDGLAAAMRWRLRRHARHNGAAAARGGRRPADGTASDAALQARAEPGSPSGAGLAHRGGAPPTAALTPTRAAVLAVERRTAEARGVQWPCARPSACAAVRSRVCGVRGRGGVSAACADACCAEARPQRVVGPEGSSSPRVRPGPLRRRRRAGRRSHGWRRPGSNASPSTRAAPRPERPSRSPRAHPRRRDARAQRAPRARDLQRQRRAGKGEAPPSAHSVGGARAEPTGAPSRR